MLSARRLVFVIAMMVSDLVFIDLEPLITLRQCQSRFRLDITSHVEAKGGRAEKKKANLNHTLK